MGSRMNILVSLLLALAAVSSCQKPGPDDPGNKDTRELSFTEQNLGVDYAGGSLSVGVNANFDYEARSTSRASANSTISSWRC